MHIRNNLYAMFAILHTSNIFCVAKDFNIIVYDGSLLVHYSIIFFKYIFNMKLYCIPISFISAPPYV